MARYWGERNQSEHGAPSTGPFGQAMRQAVGDGRVIRRAPPVATPTHKFRGLWGAVVVRPALNRGIFNVPRTYGGILPLSQQQEVAKPNPWDDPLRGAP